MAEGFGPSATPLGKAKKWLANCYDYTSSNVWPPNSPDLNPMDYYVCAAVEKNTNHRASTTKAQLIDRIKIVFETLRRETVTSAWVIQRGSNLLFSRNGFGKLAF